MKKSKTDQLKKLSDYLREQVLHVCMTANNGHIGGSLGAVELLTVLYFGGFLKIDLNDPKNVARDMVAIRGHVGPLRYPIFNLLGYLEDDEINNYRKFDSRLQGHEDYLKTPGVDFSPSGSLGMLLSYVCGAALEGKIANRKNNFFVFLGDGEEQEGNISEAARHISHLGLNNIVTIMDKNGKQLSNSTEVTDSKSNIKKIWEGYGWKVLEIKNGHSVEEIYKVYKKALSIKDRPVFIIANTIKGNMMPGCEESFSGYHTVSVCKDEIMLAAKEKFRSNIDSQTAKTIAKNSISSIDDAYRAEGFKSVNLSIRPDEKTLNNPDDCQSEYFKNLSKIWDKEDRLYFLSADTTLHPAVEYIQLRKFSHYFNTGLREQHTAAMIHGISLFNPSARAIFNTLDAFSYRWIDQLNALSQGNGNAVIIGDCSGLTNAKNGSTHQTSSQPHAVSSIPGIIYLEPWDSFDMFNCLNWAIGKSRGLVYIRSGRYNARYSNPNSNVIVDKPYNYPLIKNEKPELVIFGSGVVLSEALDACEILKKEGKIIDLINIVNHSELEDVVKYINANTPVLFLYNGQANFITKNILHTLAKTPNVTLPKIYEVGFDLGQTGDLTSLLKHYKLDSESILEKCKEILN
ncbi:MAG: Transket pyr protein [Patescibacteria group bacterium]|nr:Transket pyr protein [Patescibacteria group bacterium]MDQ5962412.1 Transket pyr protein [Patescibacteria group bacterium]